MMMYKNSLSKQQAQAGQAPVAGATAAGQSQQAPAIYQKRHRTTFNQYQLTILDEAFRQNSYPSPTLREALAKKTNLDVSRVQVWFQNRRAKYKKQANQSLRCHQYYSPSHANHHHHHHNHQHQQHQQQQQQLNPQLIASNQSHVNFKQHHYPLFSGLPLPPISAIIDQQSETKYQLPQAAASSLVATSQRRQHEQQQQQIALDLHLNSSSSSNNNNNADNLAAANNNGQQQKLLNEQLNLSSVAAAASVTSNQQSQQHTEQQVQYYEYYKQQIGSLARSTVEFLL